MSHAIRFGVLLLGLGAASAVACGGTVVFDPGPDAETPGSGGGGDDATSAGSGGGAAPLECDVVVGPISLVPVAGNPIGCRGAMSCEVWAGHGQHLTCPAFTREPFYAACDVRDCICAPYPEDGFVASFATGEVVDARIPGMTCRYTLEPTP